MRASVDVADRSSHAEQGHSKASIKSSKLRVRRMARLLLTPTQQSPFDTTRAHSDGISQASAQRNAERWGHKLTSLGAALVLAGLVTYGHNAMLLLCRLSQLSLDELDHVFYFLVFFNVVSAVVGGSTPEQMD